MKPYKYRPVLFFALAYFFTWVFWVPAIFANENIGAVLMLIGLLAPAAVSTDLNAEFNSAHRKKL